MLRIFAQQCMPSPESPTPISTPIPASVSYAPNNVKRRKRAAARYKKIAQKCRLLTMKNKNLETKVANLARQNRDLRAELAMLRCTIKQKSSKNTRNLKRLANIRATKKKGDKKVDLKVKKELEVTRGMLAAKVTQVKRLKEDARKIDEEYGELEEKYTEARRENQEKNKQPTEVLAALQVHQ